MSHPLTYIAIVNTKGGVGKTTLAMMLAHTLAQRGHKTLLLDSDDDGSAYTWAQYAKEAGTPLPFEVVDTSALPHALSGEEVEFVIVDTPANNPLRIKRLAAQTPYLLIPVQPGELELDRLSRTWDLLNEKDVTPHPDLRVGFVLNSKARTTVTQNTLKALEDNEFPIVGHMTRKVGYQECYGKPMPITLTHPAHEILTNMGIHY